MRLVYFAHNLNDPAVAKRLAMLRAAGISAIASGFWRNTPPPREIEHARVIPFGRTRDAALVHRGLQSLKCATFAGTLLKDVGEADIFMARNLEMLAIAVSAARHCPRPPAVVYEVLDIHRMLLSESPIARCLRSVERALMRDVSLLVTSSPAFLREYFEPLQFGIRPPRTEVVENKILELQPLESEQAGPLLEPGPPWRIGWLGMIRCRKSLGILGDLAKRRPDLVRVEIFGRPTREVAQDLKSVAHSIPAMTFGGSYARTDLGRLYGRMHFSWAIDYFEEGANSQWLLPNRIYEGGRYNVTPFALRGTETGNWLSDLGLGILLKTPGVELEEVLEDLTPATYGELKAAARAAPRSSFVADQRDCDRLRAALSAAIGRSRSGRPVGLDPELARVACEG